MEDMVDTVADMAAIQDMVDMINIMVDIVFGIRSFIV